MLGAAMNHRPFSKIYAFLMLIPILHVAYDYLLNTSSYTSDTPAFPISHLITIATLLTGSLLIILGEPKHSNAYIYMASGGSGNGNGCDRIGVKDS